MPYIRNLLTCGNGKLGEGIHAWSLPAIQTCPGRSDLCSQVCYAKSGRFRTRTMQSRLAANLAATQADDFVARVTAEIHRRGIHTLRIHVSGDFYDPDYVLKWVAIARRCPRTKFYSYTRSWRVPALAPALEQLVRLRNVRLWFSSDTDSGPPSNLPPGVRVAFLQTDRHDLPTGDLVFRIQPLRGQPSAHSPVTVVCPTEVIPRRSDVTCTNCRICHR